MPRRSTLANSKLVDRMRHAVGDGLELQHFSALISQVIDTGAWRERRVGSRLVRHTSFLDFVNAAPPAGMGWRSPADKQMVVSLLREDPAALLLWRQATTTPVGRPGHGKADIGVKPEHGNSRAYTLDRLSRERPDLLARVVAGELSANAAAIKAGFRRKPSVADQLWRLWQRAGKNERAEFMTRVRRRSRVRD